MDSFRLCFSSFAEFEIGFRAEMAENIVIFFFFVDSKQMVCANAIFDRCARRVQLLNVLGTQWQ